VGYLAQQRAADALPTALRPAAYTFGDQLALLGYEQRSQAQALDLTLYWQAVGLPERDYTFFVHVLDAGGKIVAQRDAPPLGGSLPTTAWPAGYRLADAVRIDMPPGLPAGQYRLAAGVYDSTTQAPLPVHGADSADGRANLGTVSWPQAPQAAR
jgi:hypothetical protein